MKPQNVQLWIIRGSQFFHSILSNEKICILEKSPFEKKEKQQFGKKIPDSLLGTLKMFEGIFDWNEIKKSELLQTENTSVSQK